jgi:hypothetical protein
MACGPERNAFRIFRRTSRVAAVKFALMSGLFAVGTAIADTPLSGVRDIEVNARRIERLEKVPGAAPSGRLQFRGGLVLSSPAKAFGGFSGIAVEQDGRRMFAVSDAGAWLTATIVYDGDAPVALRGPRMGPILGLKGRKLEKRRDVDAEAIVIVEGSLSRGVVLIGFERNHRIGRFPIAGGALQAPIGYLELPAEARRMRSNKGIEALAMLRGGPNRGAVVAFSERYPGDSTSHTGWIWLRGGPARLSVAASDDYELTGAASLDDGSLILLERRFRWTEGVHMRLRLFRPEEVRPGRVMQGEVLIERGLTSEIDNMEGLAVHKGQRGETVLTLISDDNFNSLLQRTLLLQFTLGDARTNASGAGR